MTFTIKAQPTFEWPVVIPSPNGEQTITLVFKHKTRTDTKAFFEKESKAEEDTAAKDLLEIVAGWKDADTEFSEQALGELIENYYGAVPAIFDAYVKALAGSARKNS